MTDTHIDREALKVLREVMEEGYPELLDTFLADSETRLDQLKKAENAKTLAEVAHSFKGSASNMGAVRLAALCQKLESGAKDKSPAEIVKLVAEISGEFAEVRPVYEREKHPAHTH